MQNSIGDYSFLYKIDSGSFADVYMGIHEVIKSSVAIKIINKSKIHSEKDKERVHRETNILKEISNQYIIELYEILEDENNYYFVMELATGGSLKNLIVPGQPTISEELCRHIFIQVIKAIGYLHIEKNIIHRDLKAENILLDQNNHIRLIDFGLSNIFLPGVQQTACGSPAYAAPEVVGRQLYSKSADIWSVGILLYHMSTGTFPFWDQSIPKLLAKIMNDTEVELPTFLSSDLKDLLSKLLQKDPIKRIPITEILLHPWVSQCCNINSETVSEKEKLRVFKSKIDSDSLDMEIVNELIRAGVDVNQLKSDMMKGAFNSLTAMYRIKRRLKFNLNWITNNNSVNNNNNNIKDENNFDDTEDLPGKMDYRTNSSMFKFNSCPVKYNNTIDSILSVSPKKDINCNNSNNNKINMNNNDNDDYLQIGSSLEGGSATNGSGMMHGVNCAHKISVDRFLVSNHAAVPLRGAGQRAASTAAAAAVIGGGQQARKRKRNMVRQTLPPLRKSTPQKNFTVL